MRRRKWVVAAGATVLFVAGGGGIVAATAGEGSSPDRKAAAATTTADVRRGDVVDTTTVDGTLTYDDDRDVQIAASGTVTWAPAEGATIKRGGSLLRVNDRPVTLMYGDMPLYRPLREGVSDGEDVRELERNLDALGYGDDLTVDDEFTSATAEAVREWQDDRGLDETGQIDPGQVVFEPGEIRVKDLKAPEGAKVGGGRTAMTVTSTHRIVHVDLDADKQDLAHEGAEVSVELPGGKTVTGHISDVGSVAKKKSDDSGGSQSDDTDSTIDVDITVSNAGTGRLDEAPVSVDMESERAKNVLSVPIEALLALREGGFGVEVVENGTTRILPVTTGTYGGGRVEVSGSGLREGMKVEVPSE